MDKILQAVRDFADKAHGNQTRKYSPERYIVHPIRVMETVREYSSDMAMLAAALLHDVVEDTPVSSRELLDFLESVMDHDTANLVLRYVTELTDVFTKAAYPRLNRRARKTRELMRLASTSPQSQTIKYADILDNAKDVVEHDPDFAKVFLKEYRAVLKTCDKGNEDLRARAAALVEEGLEMGDL
ncbi:HD domain-containing protein [Chitinophaga sp. GCM10012297]|uniref:HD domain-containing protein n=1 Tax=Chitinophaga chungangae TaxID=2821488 RepID=A0ABS3YEF4_9BACT|nr:HD domain-containing protein [Chitinophaga chungangae]MBO9153067.1 HD domain-containing protein [Chitinophaga chungangae]